MATDSTTEFDLSFPSVDGFSQNLTIRAGEVILTKCPVRESCARSDVSAKLGFREVRDYEQAVRQLLAEDDCAANFVRSLFDDLYEQLDV